MYCYKICRPDAVHDAIIELAIVMGLPRDGMLFRPNSACFTSEVLGCNRCDCAWQLDASLRAISAEGCGVVTYHPHHEGRGAGLLDKLRSYRVMDETVSTTASAFRRLGLPVDVRDYEPAALILNHLGVERVRLLSNSPLKHDALVRSGIGVEGLTPLVMDSDQPHIIRHLRSKADELGHLVATSHLSRG